MSPGTTSIRSSETYGWIKLIVVDGFALFFALIILVVVGTLVWEKLKDISHAMRAKK